MRTYKFAKISARNFPTLADIRNPWIFPKDVAVIICVSQYYDESLVNVFKQRGAEYHYLPLEEEVDDIGWENVKRAVEILLKYDKEDKRMVVHCDFGQHRSRLVVEAFHFAKYGRHLLDDYKGFDNHLIYDCLSCHLPVLDIVEQELFQLNRDNTDKICVHHSESSIGMNAITESLEYIGVNMADFALKNEMFARPHHEPIHGIGHIYRTMIGCALIGWQIQKPREALLAFCGAFIHDLARETDGVEYEHGENAAKKYFDKYTEIWKKYNLSEEECGYVKLAVIQHSGKELMRKGDNGYDVMAILKDADALDRCRIGDLIPEWLRYHESKRLIKIIQLIYRRTSLVNEDMEFCKFVKKAMK